jgi:hypothetical protein
MMLLALTIVLQSALQSPVQPDYQAVARRAQVRFEAIRRMHLPNDRGAPPSGPYDVPIGRFRYWYDPSDSVRIPDPSQIVESRNELLVLLDSLARLDPANGWIAGQRVRYLIEGGRADDAVQVARGCTASDWWCSALAGLALHSAQRYQSADSAYGVALAAMSAEQRCQWMDIRPLLWPRVAHELDGLGCEARAERANELFVLAQPMWSSGGNDLRTEHFARLTMAVILSRAANAEGMAWGDDTKELVERYSWPEWFTRDARPPAVLFGQLWVLGHDREPSFVLFPDIAAGGGAALREEDWRFDAHMAPSRYAPRHVSAIVDLPHAITRFPRGDSTMLVIAFDVSDTAIAADEPRLTVGTLVGPSMRLVREDSVMRTDGTRITGTAALVVPDRDVLLSIELYGPKSRRLARMRYTIDRPLPGAWQLSDLLLFDASTISIPTTLDSAVGAALPGERYTVRKPLGVLWELHAPPLTSPAWMSVTLEPVRVSAARRLAIRLHLAGNAPAIRLRWQLSPAEASGKAISLQLPDRARGLYRLTVAVETSQGVATSSAREIDLMP